MARFTVVWDDDALDELTRIWLASRDRDTVTGAAAEVERQLADTPAAAGEHVAEGLRKALVPMLEVYFSVSHEDRLVHVAAVRERTSHR